jgi:hypothetical protein
METDKGSIVRRPDAEPELDPHFFFGVNEPAIEAFEPAAPALVDESMPAQAVIEVILTPADHATRRAHIIGMVAAEHRRKNLERTRRTPILSFTNIPQPQNHNR